MLVMAAAVSQALAKAGQGAKCFHKLGLSCVLLTPPCEVRSIIPVLSAENRVHKRLVKLIDFTVGCASVPSSSGCG